MPRRTPKNAPAKKAAPKKKPEVAEKPQRTRAPKAPAEPQTIIVKLDLTGLDSLINALAEAIVVKVSGINPSPKPTETKEIKPVTQKGPDPEKEQKTEPEEVVEKPQGERVSLTKIREMINQKVSEGKATQVKSLLGKFDAKNASGLEEGQYDDFFLKLEKL